MLSPTLAGAAFTSMAFHSAITPWSYSRGGHRLPAPADAAASTAAASSRGAENFGILHLETGPFHGSVSRPGVEAGVVARVESRGRYFLRFFRAFAAGGLQSSGWLTVRMICQTSAPRLSTSTLRK